MPNNLFPKYAQGENRVTASILAVIRSLSLGRIERLLGSLMEQSEFELVKFRNQVAEGYKGVPDGEILASCRIVVETKIKRNTVRPNQLQRHLDGLEKANEAIRILLVLTPDQVAPKALEKLEDPNKLTVWTTFVALDQAIEELVTDPTEVISEREAFLLRELQAMLVEEGLVGSESEVLVVAARHAWPEYNRTHAYVCQPKRTFKPVKRIAFFSAGQVYPLVPLILEMYDEIILEKNRHKGRLGEVVNQLIEDIPQSKKIVGNSHKFFLLSAPDAKETICLDHPIPNNVLSKSGELTPFTMGHRYVDIKKLLTAKQTSDLV
jgi:hypothetical protein